MSGLCRDGHVKNTIGLTTCLAFTIGCSTSSSPTEPQVQVPISRPTVNTVRVIYAVPSDVAPNPVFADSVQAAIENVQRWYQTQLDGRTFRLYGDTPELCELPHVETFYNTDNESWSNLLQHGLLDCAPVEAGGEEHLFVIYADIDEDCTQGYSLGAAAKGLTMLGRWDLLGLTDRDFVQCGWQDKQPLGRYHGGLAHELAHTFNVRHPPFDEHKAGIMSAGYITYPDTYFREDAKVILLASPFIM